MISIRFLTIIGYQVIIAISKKTEISNFHECQFEIKTPEKNCYEAIENLFVHMTKRVQNHFQYFYTSYQNSFTNCLDIVYYFFFL